MLNLIFISNSPKARYLKTVLQPMLKVIIDVVTDFDHGLKDVFEKRPATVCIQDQIAGVTGESVARHIQMLLGTGAPRFILMHDGNSKVKPIKGLFEHVIDLNQHDEDLARDFQGMLQALLGEQWNKICVAPDNPAPSAAPSEPVLPPKADELVDELLLDFKNASLPSDSSAAVPEAVTNEVPVQTPVDEMADLLLEQARLARQSQEPVAETHDLPIQDSAIAESRLEKALASMDGTASVEPIPDGHTCQVKTLEEVPPRSRQQSSIVPDAPKPVKSEPKPAPQKNASANAAAVAPVTPPKQKPPSAPVVPVAPAEFRINRDKRPSEEPIPEDLLLAFEKNYRSKNVFMKWMLLVLLLLGVSAAGWYAIRQKPQLWTSLKHLVTPSGPADLKRSTSLVKPAQLEQNKTPAAPATPATPATAPPVPSFIPQSGHDPSYAASNPGWERYKAKSSEVRVYRNGTSIKAVQVLALKGSSLPDAFLKSVLMELTGSSDYSITSREQKAGLLVARGVVAQKADIIVYQKASSIRAFVISLN